MLTSQTITNLELHNSTVSKLAHLWGVFQYTARYTVCSLVRLVNYALTLLSAAAMLVTHNIMHVP